MVDEVFGQLGASCPGVVADMVVCGAEPAVRAFKDALVCGSCEEKRRVGHQQVNCEDNQNQPYDETKGLAFEQGG